MSEITVNKTTIEGLLEIDLTVRGDNRGWFKENYQREKLEAAGFPAGFEPVQNNVSYNQQAGVTRGLHAEPWDKYISLGYGRVFSAIVDLRPGDGFGRVETFELTPEKAIFVPQGCANGFQTLEPGTVYVYLVNAHWSREAQYLLVDPFDTELGVAWPIGKHDAIVSEADARHPSLGELRQKLGL